jgi:hypothetical protein
VRSRNAFTVDGKERGVLDVFLKKEKVWRNYKEP